MPRALRGGSSDSNEHHVPPPATLAHAISPTFRTNQPLSAGTFPTSVSSIRASSVTGRTLAPGGGSRRLGVEPVAHPADGRDEARSTRVLAELLAQLRHVHVHHVVVPEPARPPHALEQLRARERHARARRQRCEEVELDPR